MPTANPQYSQKPSFLKRISYHPTIFILGSFFNLSFSNQNQIKKSSHLKKPILYSIVLLLSLAAGFYLFNSFIYGKNFDDTSTSKSITNVKSSLINDNTAPTASKTITDLKESIIDNNNTLDHIEKEKKVDAAIWSNFDDKEFISTSHQGNNGDKIETQKLDELSKLFTEEQKKNEELSQKLNNQDKQLKELLAKYIKDIDIVNNDKSYVESITQKRKDSISDNKKIMEVDYYNKVQVLLKGKQASQRGNKQDHQIQNIVNLLLKENKAEKKPQAESRYSRSLNKESAVRSNEVRSIAIKKNETLWSMAVRAYGKGILYKKILKANPQITEENASFLQIGTLIRVPM